MVSFLQVVQLSSPSKCCCELKWIYINFKAHIIFGDRTNKHRARHSLIVQIPQLCTEHDSKYLYHFAQCKHVHKSCFHSAENDFKIMWHVTCLHHHWCHNMSVKIFGGHFLFCAGKRCQFPLEMEKSGCVLNKLNNWTFVPLRSCASFLIDLHPLYDVDTDSSLQS